MKTLSEQREAHARLLREEVARLAEELKGLGAHQVILFGSFARGRADLLTDIDLLVVLDSAEDFPTRVANLYRKLRPRVDTDILAYTPEEFERMKDRPFIRQALRDGVVLFAAEPAR